MSEYWVSKDKTFCRYCKIFIADDKPSKLLHETGFRHKGNYERYIRDIYKKGAKDKKDKAEEENEIARIDAAAHAAMAADGYAPASTSTLPSAPAPRPRPTPAASSDPYANYSTAESLGFVDMEADAAIAEAEARKNEGRIGEWQRVRVVAKPRPPPEAPEAVKPEEGAEGEGEEGAERGEGEKVAAAGWKYLKEKTSRLDDDELFDPSKVGFNLKRKRLTLREEEALREEEEAKERVKKEAEKAERRERQKLGKTKAGWAEAEFDDGGILEFDELPPKEEEGGEGLAGSVGGSLLEDAKEDKVDVKPAGPASTFKKRKGNAAARSKV